MLFRLQTFRNHVINFTEYQIIVSTEKLSLRSIQGVVRFCARGSVQCTILELSVEKC